MSNQDLCCKYCNKIFQNNFNLTKHLNNPSKKCTARMRYDINLQNRKGNFNPVIQNSVPVIQNSVPVIQNSVPIIQNSVPVIKEVIKEVIIYKKDENEINEFKTQCLEYKKQISIMEKTIQDLKQIIHDYQKDYFDCLDKYAIQIREISELKKQLIKEELTQSLELKNINLSKSL